MQTVSDASSVAVSAHVEIPRKPGTLKRPALDRLFFTGSALVVLVIALLGFEQFYFHGRQFPGRPITPPIRTLVITHGTAMALWVLLVVLQPVLVAGGKRKVHMAVGRVGAVLAGAIVVLGLMLGVASARVAPPEQRIMGFAPKEFMAVPVISVLLFGAMVGVAVWKRKKPAIHRAMMLSATTGILAAALNRIDVLNRLYEGTVWERIFGPFFFAVVLGAVLLAIRCILIRGLDKWLAIGMGIVTAVSVGIVVLAKTPAWHAFASLLVPGNG